MATSTLVSLFVIKTGLLVVAQNARGVLVSFPSRAGDVARRVEMMSWQDVEATV